MKMIKLGLFLIIGFSFWSKPVQAEQDGTNAICAADKTGDNCNSNCSCPEGYDCNSSGGCDGGYGEIEVNGEVVDYGTATGGNSYSGNPSSGINTAGGGGEGGTTGADPITDEQANAYEARVNQECLNAVEDDDTRGAPTVGTLGWGRYEMDSDDREACEDYAECMRDAYIVDTYIRGDSETSCANITLCEQEYNHYVDSVTDNTESISGYILNMLKSGLLMTKAAATTSYCNCMTHFGVQKTTSVCN